MLAQNFKTAKELSITEEQHKALIGVLGMLERGELGHIPIAKRDMFPTIPKGMFFNMGIWKTSKAGCGTALCIGGMAEELFGAEFDGGELGELGNLFYPKNYNSYNSITVDQGAAALRNYLTTGSANWAEVLGIK